MKNKTKDINLFLNEPTDEVFDEIKLEAIKMWKTCKNTSNKKAMGDLIDEIKTMKNIDDNALYLVNLFGINDRKNLLLNLSKEASNFVLHRLRTEYIILADATRTYYN